jgi:general secretion pathway protein G
MPKCVPRVWSSSKKLAEAVHPLPNQVRGFTLIELLVTLAVLSILAAAALPYAEMTVTRTKELELRRSLREARTAIDHFHEDWLSGRISKTNPDASDDGYPRDLQVLVDGTEGSDAKGSKRRYLRRIPVDPFATTNTPSVQQWVVRGYQDDPKAAIMSSRDAYDISSQSERVALDGSHYRDW